MAADVSAIRVRAHELWEAAGYPDGQDRHFWLAAEAELMVESEPSDRLVTADAAPAA